MAKRFIDTGLFDDEFFMDLSKDGKIFWMYLITKCNHAGIISINKKLASFQTGIKDIKTIMESFGNHLVMIKDDLFFFPKFIEHQYPNGLKSNKPAIVSVVKELNKYKLLDNDYTIIKDKDKDTDNSNKDSAENKGEVVEPVEAIECPFVEIEFFKAWDEWKAYKKEQHKDDYKPIGEQKALKQLYNEVEGDAQKAIEWIDYSIAKGWKGIYAPKNNDGRKQQTGITDEEIMEAARKAASHS